MEIFYKLLVSVLLLIASSVYAEHFTNIILFGDSLTDVGNNTWVDVPGRDAQFSHGAPITNLSPRTNTPLIWAQYLAAKGFFAKQSILPSRLWRGQNLQTNNIDYAYASAETGKYYTNDLVSPFTFSKSCYQPGFRSPTHSCVPGLLLQMRQYFHNLHQIHQHVGSHTMYVIWAGGNDIFDNIGRLIYRVTHVKNEWSLLLPSFEYGFSWFPTSNIHTAVMKLIDAGVPANHIYVFNLPDLAQTPGAEALVHSAFANNLARQQQILGLISAISDLYNFNLKMWLSFGVRGTKKPHLIMINQMFARMRSGNRFQGYQFTDTTHSCVRKEATPYCFGYLFFNDKHPTTTTGQLLAEFISRKI